MAGFETPPLLRSFVACHRIALSRLRVLVKIGFVPLHYNDSGAAARMALTRRQFLVGMAAGAACVKAQSRAGGAMQARPTPAICLYSRVLSKVDHVDLPMVVMYPSSRF